MCDSCVEVNMIAGVMWCDNITTKLQVFINKCLRKILRIFWPDQITNKELWKRTKQPRIDLQIR